MLRDELYRRIMDRSPPHRVVQTGWLCEIVPWQVRQGETDESKHATPHETLGPFDAYGIEWKTRWSIVTQCARLVADQVSLRRPASTVCDVTQGPITWSNELALHVLELKSTEPSEAFAGRREIRERDQKTSANARSLNVTTAADSGAPLDGPHGPAQLRPHEGAEIYQTFDRVFHCRTHGWANVQSVHLNLPFHGDEEFARLHAAVRIVLPLLPALAASSPVLAGKYSGLMDTRMMLYAEHCRAMKSLTGNLIPEPVFDEAVLPPRNPATDCPRHATARSGLGHAGRL